MQPGPLPLPQAFDLAPSTARWMDEYAGGPPPHPLERDESSLDAATLPHLDQHVYRPAPHYDPSLPYTDSSEPAPALAEARSYSSYSSLEGALEPPARSYSATSDIRGTLEHVIEPSTRVDWDREQYRSSYVDDSNPPRRGSEPYSYSASHSYESTAHYHRPSLPIPLERADSLPIRRLRRSVNLGSPGGYACSTTPSLTEESTSPSTSRTSFSDSSHGLQPSPFLPVDERGSTHYASNSLRSSIDEAAYPFPDMTSLNNTDPPQARSLFASTSPSSGFYRKRSTPGDLDESYATGGHLQHAFGDFSIRTSTGAPTAYAYVPAPPTAPAYRPSSSSSALQRSMSRDGAFGASPRRGVYEVNGARQVFLPSASTGHSQQYAPFGSTPLSSDGYDGSGKRRRMSFDPSNRSPDSLGSRRQAASSLHLAGLPPPPLAVAALDVAQEQAHYQLSLSPSTSYEASAGWDTSIRPHTPRTAPAGVARFNSLGYASFTTPAFLDGAPPLTPLDSPFSTPGRDRPFPPPSPQRPITTGSAAYPSCLPLPPPSSHAYTCFDPPAPLDHLPIPPPLASYPQTPDLGTSAASAAVFDDPAYPNEEKAPWSVCHRRPPQEDFDTPPPGGEPYEQKLRFEEDQYTPKWVRFEKTTKEGWCALCPGDGKWLQLKNSAFWYHRQFIHGVSSSSGHYFLPPLELRQEGENGKILGLCHTCGEYQPYLASNKAAASSTAKPPDRTPSQWFHHAHKCHTYFSPRKEARKNAKLSSSK
ncbi:hypothetical protein JCM10207_006156 [Rhodosporidiobolus poonsookiae]